MNWKVFGSVTIQGIIFAVLQGAVAGDNRGFIIVGACIVAFAFLISPLALI